MKTILFLLVLVCYYSVMAQQPTPSKGGRLIMKQDSMVKGIQFKPGPISLTGSARFIPFSWQGADSLRCGICRKAFLKGDALTLYVTLQHNTGLETNYAHPACTGHRPRYVR